MSIPNTPLHRLTRVAASAALFGSPCRVFAILLNGGSTASSLKLTNDANGSGTAVINVVAQFTDSDASAADCTFVDFTSLGGIEFSSKCYATIAGTSAEAFIWWD